MFARLDYQFEIIFLGTEVNLQVIGKFCSFLFMYICAGWAMAAGSSDLHQCSQPYQILGVSFFLRSEIEEVSAIGQLFVGW